MLVILLNPDAALKQALQTVGKIKEKVQYSWDEILCACDLLRGQNSSQRVILESRGERPCVRGWKATHVDGSLLLHFSWQGGKTWSNVPQRTRPAQLRKYINHRTWRLGQGLMIREAGKETQQFKHSAADSELLLHQLPTRLVPRTPRYSNHTLNPQEKQKNENTAREKWRQFKENK